jgi:hypothetical protein
MIAPLRSSFSKNQTQDVRKLFLAMLPRIRQQARIAFGGLRTEAREELTQEVVANAYCAFIQLVRRNKTALAYPTPLAQFAIRQVRAGRRVGGRLNVRDILSHHARRTHQLTIDRLDRRDPRTGVWNELLVEDRRSGPPEIAAARLDVVAWFRTMSVRNRRIAQALAVGTRTVPV